ncbi:RTA1-domain-containing protein [Xylariaceae sp. FL1019]|nr:RTA1-domain-containing protein [Xylariaceae sp. FL1019]
MGKFGDEDCTFDTCDPNTTSYYGYRPNLGIDVFFAAVYAVIIGHCLFITILKRKWLSYSIVILIGSIFELVGYIARVEGYHDPWKKIGWILQYSLITLAPVFMTAAMYVCLGRTADIVGRGYFNISPRRYSRVFIPTDVVILLIQGIGGGISVKETVNNSAASSGISTGSAVIIVGLVAQVVSLTTFLVLYTAVVWPSGVFRPKSSRLPLKQAKRLRTFVITMFLAILLILGRSGYRVAELSQGISADGLVHNELLFILFDSFPVAIATTLMVVFHPYYFLPNPDVLVSPEAGKTSSNVELTGYPHGVYNQRLDSRPPTAY